MIVAKLLDRIFPARKLRRQIRGAVPLSRVSREEARSGERVRWNIERTGRTQLLTYEIAADGKSIRCLRCGRTSYNPDDVQYRYCGCCHRFH